MLINKRIIPEESSESSSPHCTNLVEQPRFPARISKIVKSIRSGRRRPASFAVGYGESHLAQQLRNTHHLNK